MSLADDIKDGFKKGDAILKLIYVNLGVFISLYLITLVLFLFNVNYGAEQISRNWLSVPSNFLDLLLKPWTLFTYMFGHYAPMHLISNLILVYFAGRLFVSYLTDTRIIPVYIMGGLSGAVLYILFYNIFPVFADYVNTSTLIGASAAGIAILAAITTYVPNLPVRLFFMLEVRLKYIAFVLILIDLVSITQSNSGGHISHLGGALFGYFYIRQLQKGKDWTLTFRAIVGSLGTLFKSKKPSKMNVAYKNKRYSSKLKTSVDQDRIDSILDKISKSGYDSLTKEEKDILFKASKD